MHALFRDQLRGEAGKFVRISCRVSVESLQHALEVFLKVQYGLQTLSNTITHGVILRWGSERPGTLALTSVILPEVRSVALDLRLV